MNNLPPVGVLTGKFAPLHAGQIFMISQAATQVQKLYVILSFDQKFIDKQPEYLKEKLTLNKRLLWLKRTFQNMPHIEVLYVDETNVPSYPNGVKPWCQMVKNSLHERGVNKIDKWFSSEPEYTWWIEENFNCENVIIDADRKQFPISATMIRENPYQHWQYLPSIVRKEFLLKVVLIGQESSAKSTLTRTLAKVFNTSWVEEYGRTFCEVDMCGDESLLSFDDYGLIASNRYYQEKEAERTSNKVLFLDTNAFITQYYCILYEGKPHPLVDAYIQQEKYDLILHMEADVPWVDDGLRINSDRTKTTELFEKMILQYGISEYNSYYRIKGTYQERLTKAMQIVQETLCKRYE